MMATKPRAAAKTVDCEECRHFSGSGLANTFTCAKGHARERAYSLVRLEGCGDFAKLGTDEQILKRFSHSAKFYGDADIKKRRIEVRRTTTSIRKTIDSFGKFMTAKQVEAQRMVDETARRAALVAKHVGDQDVLAIAADLLDFNATGKEWLKVHRSVDDAVVAMQYVYELQLAVRDYLNPKPNQRPVSLDAIKEIAALCMADIEETAANGARSDYRFASPADFAAFRAWRQSISDAVSRAAGGKTGGAE
jgi:hypothetical protein